MDNSAFPTDTINIYGGLKRALVRAVNLARGHNDKTIWLTAVLDAAEVAATALTTIEVSEWTQDDNSEAFITVKRELSLALGRNSFKLSADGVLLTAIIAAANTVLNA